MYIKSVYINLQYDDKHFLKYFENYDDDTKTTITIYRILPMESNDTIEETLATADEEDNGLSIGDIC